MVAQTTYMLKQVTEVVAGEKYVFEQSSYVMISSINNSSALQTTAPYNTAGLLGNENYVWTLETATEGFKIKSCNKASSPYLKSKSSATDMLWATSSEADVWSFSFTDGIALIEDVSNGNRYLGYTTANSHLYKAYTSSGYASAIKVYQLVEDGSVPSHTVTFVADGETFCSSDYKEGAAISFDTDEPLKPGFKFMGWSATEIETPQNTAPAYVTSANMGTEDITYYAVFANKRGGAEKTVKFGYKGTTGADSYKQESLDDDMGNTWSYYAMPNVNVGVPCIGLNKNEKNYHIASPEFEGNITAISFAAYNGSSSESRKFLFCSSNSNAQPTKGDIAEVLVEKSERFGETHTLTFEPEQKLQQFYIYVSAALSIGEISVTYCAMPTYFGYTTHPVLPEKAEVKISSVGYATFVTDYAMDFTDSGVEAYVMSDLNVVDGKMLLSRVDKVPAGEAVVVRGETKSVSVVAEADGVRNRLKYSDEAVAYDKFAGKTIYILALNNEGNGVGFYPVGSGNVAAGKGYFTVDTPLQAKGFVLEFGGVTGIKNVSAGSTHAQVYNLAGQRVARAKGIVIRETSSGYKKVIMP